MKRHKMEILNYKNYMTYKINLAKKTKLIIKKIKKG